MRSYNFVVERDPETNLLIGYVPGWPGAHSQGADIDMPPDKRIGQNAGRSAVNRQARCGRLMRTAYAPHDKAHRPQCLPTVSGCAL